MKKYLFIICFVSLIALPLILLGQDLKEVLTLENSIPILNNEVLRTKDTCFYFQECPKFKSQCLFEEGDFEIIDHKYFKIGYSQRHKQPGWVAYLLTKEMVVNQNAKRKDRFLEDRMVSKGTATRFDYKNSGYDKGHICPSRDMSFCQQIQDLTFLMSNICPQKHSFNAGKWLNLEEKVRQWAVENDSILIISGPLLDSIIETIGFENKISVPYRFYKVIIDISSPSYKMIGFVMPNQALNHDIYYYSMSLSDVERLSKFVFFPDFEENEAIKLLKQDCNISHWERE